MTTLKQNSPKAHMLLTDTTPAEVPIIFSNRGLYENVVGHCTYLDHFIGRNLLTAFFKLQKGRPRETTPFKYDIHKSLESFRTLSLIHPSNQISLLDFYESHSSLLLYYCARSHFTLRAPHRTGRPTEIPKDWRHLALFRLPDDNGHDQDPEAHLGHFFRYRGYSRVYKFFGSDEYIKLERTHKHLYMMDVSDCFNSLYTHSLAWSVKSIPSMKTRENRSADTFGQEFDLVMRQANAAETNGIVIGPEASRIFAEVIFQTIDIDAEREIFEECNLKSGENYDIRRYVDDIFLFADSRETAEAVVICYRRCLSRYKLSFNEAKTKKYERPFVTKKSRVIRDVEIKTTQFLRSFLHESKSHPRLIPKKITRLQRMVSEFVNRIKNVCSYNDMDYEAVSGYIIGILSSRIKTLVNSRSNKELNEEEEVRCTQACTALIKAAFYFYHVAPTVQSSYRLSTSCIILKRHADQFLGPHAFSVHQTIFEEITDFLLSKQSSGNSPKNRLAISLERLNLLLVLADFNKEHLPAKEIVLFHLREDENLSYFEIVCLLYVIGTREDLVQEKRVIQERIDERFTRLEGKNFQNDSESVHLLLDVLSCPFVDRDLKVRCIRSAFRSIDEHRPSDNDIDKFLDTIKDEYWFIDWNENDILVLLQEKEQRAAY